METNETQAPQYILKLPNVKKYIKMIEDGVRARKGRVDPYLAVQIRDTALLMKMVDQLVAEINHSSPAGYETGSVGQDKLVANPLYATYAKLHQQLLSSYTALGLNYNLSPEKVSESDVANVDDPLSKMLSDNP